MNPYNPHEHKEIVTITGISGRGVQYSMSGDNGKYGCGRSVFHGDVQIGQEWKLTMDGNNIVSARLLTGTYDPMKEIEAETWIERGLLNPRNYVALVGYSLLVFVVDCLLGYGIWQSIVDTFLLLPSTPEQVRAWKTIIPVAVISFWQLVFFALVGEDGILALPGSVMAFIVLVFVL